MKLRFYGGLKYYQAVEGNKSYYCIHDIGYVMIETHPPTPTAPPVMAEAPKPSGWGEIQANSVTFLTSLLSTGDSLRCFG